MRYSRTKVTAEGIAVGVIFDGKGHIGADIRNQDVADLADL